MSLIVKTLGHAGLLFQLGNTCILSDPWLAQWMFGCCRRFPDPGDFEMELPTPDIVVLSHHHWDHVHIPTLDCFDRETRFLIPENEQLKDILRFLGFQKVQILKDWERFSVTGGEIIATPSKVPFGEMGILVSTDRAFAWNLVDTVFGADEVKQVNELVQERTGICFAPYQSYDEMSLLMRKNSPQRGRVLQENAKNLSHLNCNLIIPAADGLYYPESPMMNAKSFLNHPFDFIDAIYELDETKKCMISLVFDEFHLCQEDLVNDVRVKRTLPYTIQEVLDLYDRERSFQPDVEFEKAPFDERFSRHKELVEFCENIFHEDFLEEFNRDILDLMREERAVWVLEFPGIDFCVQIDFVSGKVCLGESTKPIRNCGLRIPPSLFLDLCYSRQLLSIAIQTPFIEASGSNHTLSYRSLDVLWYAGFEDQDRLEAFVNSERMGKVS